MYFKDHTPAAHMLHSRLQMVWKKLIIEPFTPADQIVSINIEIFQKVVTSMKIPVSASDMNEAAELLLYSIFQNQPVYYFEILNRQVVDGYATAVSITSHDGGRTISPADARTRWTEEDAREMLLLMKDFDPKRDIWIRGVVVKFS